MKLYQIISYNKKNKIQWVGDMVYEGKDQAEAIRGAMVESTSKLKSFDGDRLEIHTLDLMRK